MDSISLQHPSLQLGAVVDMKVISLLSDLDKIKNREEAAYSKMNSLLSTKRTLAMTLSEFGDMGIDTAPLVTRLSDLDQAITKAAAEYVTIKIECEAQGQQVKESIGAISAVGLPESPVDFSASKVKIMPLASESLRLDAQYFSFTKNADNVISNIEKYVRDSTVALGEKSVEVGKEAAQKTAQQVANHSIAGTLIITVSCQHRHVSMLEPLVIDPDKGISSWNSQFAGNAIDTLDPRAVAKSKDTSANDDCITLISGASYGSSFVGMVHMLKSEVASIGDVDQLVVQLQEKLKLGGWLQEAQGGFGVDSSIISEVKRMLSTQVVSSHVSMIVTGAAPSISSNQLQVGIGSLLNGVASQAAFPDAVAEKETVGVMAGSAKKGEKVLQTQKSVFKTVMKGLGEADRETNAVLDINSLMAAFQNYLTCIKTSDGSVGVPVSFHIRRLRKNQIKKVWLDKYYPEAAKSTEAKPAGAKK